AADPDSSPGRLNFRRAATIGQRFEERGCSADGLGRHVAVAAQFDGNRSFKADLVERTNDRRGGKLAPSEHQMLMDSCDHVFNMNIDNPAAPARDQGRDRALAHAVNMTDVDRELEQWMADPLIQAGESFK